MDPVKFDEPEETIGKIYEDILLKKPTKLNINDHYIS